MKNKIQRAVALISKANISNLPVEIMQLKEKMMSKHPNTSEIASLINKNPELNALFIKISNLNIGKDKESIKSAKSAIDILGMDEVERLFVAACVVNSIVITKTEAEFLLRGIKIGIAAAELSIWVHGIERAEAYMAGLLSEIGGVVLNRVQDGYIFREYKNYLSKPISTSKEALDEFGTELSVVSALLCKKWGVSPIITKAVLLQNQNIDKNVTEKNASNTVKLTGLIGLSRSILCEIEDATYMTEQYKKIRNMSVSMIGELPSSANKAAISAVALYGDKIKLSEIMGSPRTH